MVSLFDNYQIDVVEAFNSTSRYLDYLLNIDKRYFGQMVSTIYSTKLQSNNSNYFKKSPRFVIVLVHRKWHRSI